MTDEKAKFNFKCTKCGNCCSQRGPIPLVLDDLTLWAKNKVVANFMPYLKFIRTPFGTLDLVLARDDKNPFEESKKEDKKSEEKVDLSCPLFNKEKKECLVYDNRPLSCRTYPLEFDGKSFSIVDDECKGVGQGETTVDERKFMRSQAETMNKQLTQMRIAMPVLAQAMQTFTMMELIKQQQEYMSKMTPEERAKMDEDMGKDEKSQ